MHMTKNIIKIDKQENVNTPENRVKIHFHLRTAAFLTV